MDDVNIFTIDTSPRVKNDLDVPRYQVGRKSTELLSSEVPVFTPRWRTQPNSNAGACWNCGNSTHSIRNCEVRYNPYTQEWNREIMNINKMRNSKTASRYHEVQKTGTYANRIPGPPSARLRKLLGISETELPPYIYRLRQHGYPDAWLKYATVKPSGINLYDEHGKEVADPNAEDGEILEEEDKLRYDLSKLIQFPGFNVPLPDGCEDEHVKYDAWPFSPDQSMDSMIKKLEEKALGEYILKKNKSKQKIASQDTKDTETDMEIDSFIESTDTSETEGQESFIPPLPEDKPALPFPPEENVGDSNSTPSKEESSTSESEKASTLGRVISSQEGTPLLRSKCGHVRLPPAENFSKNICDVINFENLPESTGKFEQMRGLLRKVKEILGVQRKKASSL